MSAPFVVVGGDAAGLSAASKLKRERPDHEVIVFEKGNWVSYAHCGMPYFVKGEVESLTDLLSLTPDEIRERGIDLRRRHEVVEVTPESKTVTVEREGNQFDQPYDTLLLATGGHAVSAPLDGASLDGVFTMHHMDAAGALRAYLTPPQEVTLADLDGPFLNTEFVERYAKADPPTTAAIVGGGYVGVEMAEAFDPYDLNVHLFQRTEELLPPFGPSVGRQVDETLRNHGVTLHRGTEVEQLVGNKWVEAVSTAEDRFPADLVLVGIGVRPNTGLIEETEIELGDSGAISTDDYGRTNVENIYAAGDCAEMRHAVTDEPSWVPLGLTANRAGRAIGQTVAGTPTPVGDIAGTAAVKAFDLEAGRTGLLDHDRMRQAGFDPVSETITASSRSGYYPGAADTTVTLTADRHTGRLLGGSIVGTDRAAIRIDTIATALEQDMTVPEVERLDLAYAPPFSPVWDPVLVAAKVLNGTLEESPER